jgi:dUTP pyrophosphatase
MLKVYKTHPSAYLPHLATEGSACFDVHASLQYGDAVTCYHYGVKDKDVLLVDDFATIIIAPGMRTLIPVNLIFDIPEGFSLRAHPRSGLSLKQGLTLFNCEGVIDSDYVEPLFITLYNISGIDQIISDGDRIAQVELVRSEQYTIEEVLDRPLHKTDRVGGFGSTGVKL